MMGYDISYHPINSDDINELYCDVLKTSGNIEALSEKYDIDEFYQEKYQEIIATARRAMASTSFDSTHGYYIANIHGLVYPYHYVRGAAFSFLYDAYPHYRSYTLPWKSILKNFNFQQSIHDEILTNYSSGAYIPSEQVRQLLEDYEAKPMIRQELDHHYSHGRISVFLDALKQASAQGKGLLEASEVIEVNPLNVDESTCYSDIHHVVTKGVSLYEEAAREQVSAIVHTQKNNGEHDAVPLSSEVDSIERYNAEATYARALDYFADSEVSDAESFIMMLLNDYPFQEKIQSVIGRAYLDEGLCEKALTHLIEAQELGCDHFYLYYLIGTAYKNLYRYDDAISAYETSSKLYPYYALNHIRMGDIHEILGQWEQAKRSYQQAIDISSALPEYFNNLGVYEAKLGDKEKAVHYYQRAVVMRPSYYDANKNLVWDLYRLKNYEQAVIAAEYGLEHVQSKGALYDVLGRALEKLDQQGQAIVYYKKAIEEYPKEPEAFSNLTLIYQKQKKYEDALEVIHKGIDHNPHYAFGYFRRANVYKKLERYEESRLDYEKAIELGERSADVYVFWGNVLSSLKKSKESILAYEKAIEADPEYLLAHFNMAMSFWGMGDEDNALKKLTDALHINPVDSLTLNSLGKYLRQLKRYEESNQAYEKLLINQPKDKKALINCGYNYYDIKHYKVAIEYFDQVLLEDPAHADALRLAGVASYYLEDDPAAIEYYTRGIEFDGANASLLFNRALCYQNLKQLTEAIADYEKTIALNPNHEKAKNNMRALKKEIKKGGIKGLFSFKKKPK